MQLESSAKFIDPQWIIAVNELGEYRELYPHNRLLGDAVFAGTLFLTLFLERLQFQLRHTEASAWWASNGRDVVNLFALATMSLGLRVIGFSGAISFTIAATLILILNLLQSRVGEHRFALTFTALATFLLGAIVLLAPRRVDYWVRMLLSYLFEG